ncbi:hypothetical protein [Roseibium sp. MMSF_3412]|uniref:hypothetical protein n=1 Tax=Roseibium sp. MMSF_3412 TaxID=3046712 RepID=UPI00273F9E32|nr:hypothetical protein [Roseibium sp. MMSF_3412]
MLKRAKLTISVVAALAIGTSALAETSLDIKFAGALEFSEDGTLFVGDNHNGAIFAFEIPEEANDQQIKPSSIANIDAKIAELLGVNAGAIEINDIAAHPVSNDIYISVTRIGNLASQPAIITISRDQQLALLDIDALPFQRQELTAYPEGEPTFGVRGMGPFPPLPRDIAKGDIPLNTLAIMDIEYFRGELFVSGVAHDNFLSSLRRISYPFDGTQGIASVEMYHITHDQYESRAPIRAMSVQEIDGKPQLVAAYTCSPIVLVPLDEITDGAKISARTLMDYGNGQPLDMISFIHQSPFGGDAEPMLFVTSDSRSPQVIPISGLQDAQVVTHDVLPRGPKLDMHPLMPYGPVGKAVMFNGVPLHTTLVGGGFFTSVTRDPYTGDLNLDTNPTWFPNRIHDMLAEMDFPQYQPDPSRMQ